MIILAMQQSWNRADPRGRYEHGEEDERVRRWRAEALSAVCLELKNPSPNKRVDVISFRRPLCGSGAGRQCATTYLQA